MLRQLASRVGICRTVLFKPFAICSIVFWCTVHGTTSEALFFFSQRFFPFSLFILHPLVSVGVRLYCFSRCLTEKTPTALLDRKNIILVALFVHYVCSFFFLFFSFFHFRIMSLSGSPIVNHGPAPNAQVFIPLGNGRVRILFCFSFVEQRENISDG